MNFIRPLPTDETPKPIPPNPYESDTGGVTARYRVTLETRPDGYYWEAMDLHTLQILSGFTWTRWGARRRTTRKRLDHEFHFFYHGKETTYV